MDGNGVGHDVNNHLTGPGGTDPHAPDAAAFPRKADARHRPSPAFSLVLLLLVAAVAYVGSAGLDQSLRAARGEGAPGVFTVSALSCVQHPGHESCTCHGRYTPDSGGEARGVYLHAAGRDICRDGEEIPVVDVGAANRVYGPDGSREWMLSSVLLAGSAAAVGGLTVTWVRHVRGIRTARRLSQGA